MTNRYQQLSDTNLDSLLSRVNAVAQPVPLSSQATEFRLVTVFYAVGNYVAIIEKI